MSATVWKYQLELQVRTLHGIPIRSGPPVAFMVRGTSPNVIFEVWFLVNPDNPREERSFWIRATGEPIPDNEQYLLTTRHDPSLTVWHLTEVIQ